MERIARETRLFREAELKRIAAEKDEARKALEYQKQQERERIAFQSGQFLEDAVKEREQMSRLKSLTIQQQREEELRLEADVSEKARQLSVKEQLEKQRKLEERLVLQQRELKKSSSKDTDTDTASLQSFSGDMERNEDRARGQALSRETTVYYDASMSQASLEQTSELESTKQLKTPVLLKKTDTIYYDATPDPQVETFQTPMPMEKFEETKDTVYFDTRLPLTDTPHQPMTFQTPGQGSLETVYSNPDTTTFQTPMPIRNVPVPDPSQNTIYFDASTMRDQTSSDVFTSPAGAHARALFAGKDDDTFPTETSNVDPTSEERIMAHRLPRVFQNVQKKELPEHEEPAVYTRMQEACYEIPIEYNPSTGSFTVTRDAEISMSTSMAPSRVDGRWTGSLEGKASLGPSAETNSAVGSVTLDYSMNNWSKLSLGMIRGHELFHPLITIGGSLVRHGSTLGVTFYHNASFLQAMLLEHSMYSISFRHLFPGCRWTFSSELSRRQDLSLALSNSKILSRISWSLRNPERMTARLELHPKLREDRTAHIFGEWQSFGSWQLGGSLVQSLHSKIATVGLGVRLFSARGLEWVLSWNRGDATVRIPVVVTTGIQNVNFIQAMYFSLLSYLIQEAIAELWGWNNPVDKNPEEDQPSSAPTITTAKARQDAELQKDLMSRQAKRKKREEVDKEGLVIHKATYALSGGEEWDATVPLQFWVNRSSLTLPPTSKSQLLGFYDITSAKKNQRSNAPHVVGASQSGSWLWWKAMWNDLMDLSTSTLPSNAGAASRPNPTLYVRYDFKGQAYHITIQDEQELILPNPNARRL